MSFLGLTGKTYLVLGVANKKSVAWHVAQTLEAEGARAVSSRTLAERFHLNAAQIRKDLAYFGEFGVRGVGYYVKELRRHLRQILGLDRKLRVAIMGAGNLGLALADYPGFRQEGFEIAALFDSQASKVGEQSRGGVPIHDMRDLAKTVKRDGVSIAVLAVPAGDALLVVAACWIVFRVAPPPRRQEFASHAVAGGRSGGPPTTHPVARKPKVPLTAKRLASKSASATLTRGRARSRCCAIHNQTSYSPKQVKAPSSV